MSIQDYIITICEICLFFALLPTVFSAMKPPIKTSAMFALLLGTIAITFLTLDLTLSFLSAGATAITWGIIGVQSIYTRRKVINE